MEWPEITNAGHKPHISAVPLRLLTLIKRKKINSEDFLVVLGQLFDEGVQCANTWKTMSM